MAYGASWRSKGYDPDPRDVVEEAARAAGMSVEEWLDTAAEAATDNVSRRRRRNRFSNHGKDNDSPLGELTRRLARRGGGRVFEVEDSPSEERVARIVSEAVDSFEESLRATEARTASALAALSRSVNRPASEDIGHVRSLINNLEHGNTLSRDSKAPLIRDHQHDQNTLTRQLESRIANVVDLIESKAAASVNPLPRAVADTQVSETTARSNRDLRPNMAINAALARVNDALRGLEQSPQQTEILKTLKALDQRLSGLEKSPQGNPELIGQMVGEMAALHHHMSAQNPGADLSSVSGHMVTLGERIDALSRNIGTQPAQSSQFERLLGEISDLRSSLKTRNTLSDPGFETLRTQMTSMGDRLDGLTDKLASLRMNGTRDLRPTRAIDGDLAELKLLIQSSQAPVQDERVIKAVQALETKIANLERTPKDLSSRLDHIQSLMGERPVAALPAHVESLLQNLATRLKDIDSAPEDDLAFARLHDEIRQISRKLEQVPGAMQIPAVADVSGLERSISAMLQEMNGLKADMGNLAEHAARKATQEAISHIPVQASAALPDLSGIEHSIQSLFRQIDGWKSDMGMVAEEAARKATQEAIRSIPVSAAPPVTDLSGIEQSIQGMYRQMDALKADIGQAAEDAERRAANDSMRHVPVLSPAVASHDSTEMQRALSDIQVSQKDAERRTTQTLEAVHDTLKRVVDRLVDMEKDIAEKSLPPVMAPGIATPSFAIQSTPVVMPSDMASPMLGADVARKPLGMQSHPVEHPTMASAQSGPLQSHANALPLQSQPGIWNTANPVSENAAATIAAIRAQRLGVSSPTITTTTLEPKSVLASALSAARGAVAGIKLPGSKRADPKGAEGKAEAVHGQGSAFEPGQSLASPLALDMPLEPGSGRPVATQTGYGKITSNGGLPADDPKAQFLAAARRAAQTAADEAAGSLGSLHNKTNDMAGNKKGLKTRHALLLGLAALIVAVGATLQFTGMPTMLGGAAKKTKEAPGTVGTIDHIRKQVQMSHLNRKNSVEYSAEAAKSAPRQILTEIPESQLPPPLGGAPRVRDVANLDSKSTVATARPLATSPVSGAGSDPVIVGSLGNTDKNSELTKNVFPSSALTKPSLSISNDPLFRFEGLQNATNLKEAARKGDISAYIEIGTRFADGKGATRNPVAAALWYERAAELGSAPARYRLGTLYREGRGVERNPKMAFSHFQSAAELGNARAMHNAAVLLAEGVNGAPDYAAAADWFRKAAEFGIRDSQFNLAILYARGLGTTQDLVASYSWFSAAAKQGDEDAGKKRDEVGARMSQDQLKIAKEAAASWKAKSPDVAANEVAVPDGGWDAPSKTTGASAKPKANRI